MRHEGNLAEGIMKRCMQRLTYKIVTIVFLIELITLIITDKAFHGGSTIFWPEVLIKLIVVPLIVFIILRHTVLTKLRKALTFLKQVESGDWSARISEPIAQDEIGQLLQGMNSMAAKLQETTTACKHELLVREQMEETLAKEQNLLRTLIDHLPALFYVKDTASRFLRANAEIANIMGVTKPEELIGKMDFDFYPHELADQYYRDEREVIESGNPLINKEELVIDQQTKAAKWFLTTKIPVRDSQGKIMGLVGINRDITERKRTEEALRQSETLFHSLLEALPQNIFSKDLEGRFTYANQRYCKMHGKSLAEIIGKTDYDLHSEELAQKYRTDDRQVVETGQVFETVEEHQALTGERFAVQVIKTPMCDANGRINGIIGVFWDITERERAECIQNSLYRISEAAHTAQTLKEFFRLIHKIVAELIAAKNFYIALYDAATATLSFPYFVDEYKEKPASRKLGKGLTEYVLRTGTSLLASSESLRELVREGAIEGITAPFGDCLCVPLQVHEKTIGVLGVRHYTGDVHFGEEDRNILLFVSTQIAMAIERIRAEEALRENEERYRNLVENALLGIISIDTQGHVIDVNPMLTAMLGSPSAEAIREINFLTLPSLIEAGIAGDFRQCVESGFPVIEERLYNTEWGKQVYLRYYLTPIRAKDLVITGVQAIVEDVTERMLVENALKESEAEYRFLFKNMHSGLAYHKILVDDQNHPIDYVFLEINEAYELLLGLKRDIIGKRVTEVLPEIQQLEPNLIKVCGKVALTGEKVTFDSFFEPFGIWFSISAYSPQKGYFVTVFEDITERKWAEESLRKLNEDLEQRVEARTVELQKTNKFLHESLETLERTKKQLVESEKMAALGGLVAGVAHEINTPVGIGVTAASHLAEQTQEFSDLYSLGQMKRSDLDKYVKIATESTTMILENLKRAAENIYSFKQIAVDHASDKKRIFNFKHCIDNVLLSLHPKLKGTQHNINVQCPKDIDLESYPGAFAQIFTNLIMNSLIHGFEDKTQGAIVLHVTREHGALRIHYSDNGKGMPAETRVKVFEPFFTTKRGQGGSGLGLHIVYNLVTQKLGGQIACESTPDVGTTFTIEIPIQEEQHECG
jgi:PAS domain S-box-containing protein